MTINVISQLHKEATGLIDNFTISSVAAWDISFDNIFISRFGFYEGV